MARRISPESILLIKTLRSKGWSLPEIYKKTRIGYGSIFRYIQNIQILPKYQNLWKGKRGGSIKRKNKLEKIAQIKAKNDIKTLNSKDKLLLLTALYWAEGGKTDFNFINSDPEMVRIFVTGLREVFKITPNDLKVSIRLYEDLDKQTALAYWSKITQIPSGKFVKVNVLKGKKSGKLKYGMCRIRIKRGGNMLKYLLALNKRIGELY